MGQIPIGRALPYARYPLIQRIHADAHIAPDVFRKIESAGRCTVGGPSTLVPDFAGLKTKAFHPDRAHPSIAAFYESTKRHDIVVQHFAWRRWALPLSVPYRHVSGTFGNLRVPLSITQARNMTSDVCDIDLDDGGLSRQWIRTFTGDNSLFYAAAVRVMVAHGNAFFSLAFPIRGAHLAVILAAENYAGDGLRLTTRGAAPAGTYIVRPVDDTHFRAFPGGPTTEDLTFTPGPSGIVLGEHVDRLAGFTAFEMKYEIRVRS